MHLCPTTSHVSKLDGDLQSTTASWILEMEPRNETGLQRGLDLLGLSKGIIHIAAALVSGDGLCPAEPRGQVVAEGSRDSLQETHPDRGP